MKLITPTTGFKVDPRYTLGSLLKNYTPNPRSQSDPFYDRHGIPVLGFGVNLLKDIKDVGEGIATLASFLPQVISGKADVNPGDLLKGVIEGYKYSYGQQNGFNLGNLLKSFYYHPLNILDVAPILPKAGPLKALSKIKAGAEAIGDTARIGGKFRILKMGDSLSSMRKVPRMNNAQIKSAMGVDAMSMPYDMRPHVPVDEMKRFAGAFRQESGKAKSMGLDITLDANKAIIKQMALKRTPINLSHLYDVKGGTRSRQVLSKQNTRFLTGLEKPPIKAEYVGAVEKALNKSLNWFTPAVLANPGWLTGNLGGDAFFSYLRNLNPNNLKRAMNPKWRGLMPKELQGTSTKGLVGLYGSTGTTHTGFKPFDKYSDMFFNLERKRESAFRRAGAIQKLRNLAKESLKSQGKAITGDTLYQEAQRMSRMSPYIDQAVKASRQMFGDYRTFNAREKSLRLIIPFYKWYREASKVVGSMPFTDPMGYQLKMRAPAMAGGTARAQQDRQLAEMGYKLNRWQEGGMVQGFDDKGNPVIFNLSKALPTTAVGDLAGSALDLPSLDTARYLSPLLNIPIRSITGTNFTGAPASAPGVVTDYLGGKRYHVNEQSGEITALRNSELPDGYQLSFLLSELLRNFTPAGSLERWLPYRSYDSLLGVPAPYRDPKPMSSYVQNFGLGSTNTAYRSPEPDEKARKRLLRRYGELYKGEERVAQKPGRKKKQQGRLSTAPSLQLNLGGKR